MKNILSKFGTKTVAGVVLAGATLVVGLGVVSNFSGGSQKAANEAALSRFNDSAYNNFTGNRVASRADLERQISAGRDGYSARFLQGQSAGFEDEEAFSSDGAYAEGVRDNGTPYGQGGAYGANGDYGVNGAYGTGDVYSANISAYANGDAYKPFDSTYEQGEGDFGKEGRTVGAGSAEYAAQQFQAAQAAAAAAAGQAGQGKAGKGGSEESADGKGIRPATQLNKLNASKGGSSFGNNGAGARGGATPGSYSASIGGNGPKGGDNGNTQVLPPPNMPKTGDSDSFKFGRTGAMGGFNVGVGGKEVKGSGMKSGSAVADMRLAYKYSTKARGTDQIAGMKSLADAAFDGANPEGLDTTIEDGATIETVASTLKGDLRASKPEDKTIDFNEDARAKAQLKELNELQRKFSNKVFWLMGSILVAAIGVFFLVQAAKKATVAWPLWLAAGVLTAAALVAIVWVTYLGKNSLMGIINQMADSEKFGLVNNTVDFGTKIMTTHFLAGGLAALVGMAWINWKSGLTKWWGQLLMSNVSPILLGIFGTSITAEATNLYNINKNKKK